MYFNNDIYAKNTLRAPWYIFVFLKNHAHTIATPPLDGDLRALTGKS